MSGAVKAVGSAIGGVTSFLTGGKKTPIQGKNFGNMTSEEQTRLNDIETQINNMFGEQGTLAKTNLAQSQDAQNLFSNNLKEFLSNGGVNQSAVDAVDQYFTNPAQNAINQNVADYGSQASAKAAALGRNPNADIATQQAIAGEGMRQNIGLQAERGNRIQQASLSNLGAGMQGSSYLNQLGQQAFSNRLNLLNGRTGLADIYQKERGLATTNGTQTSSGLFNNLSSIAKGGKDLYSSFSGGGGGGGSPGGSLGSLGDFGGLGGIG